MSPAKHVTLKMTGPTIYSTVLIREDLKHLTICDPILEKVVKGERKKCFYSRFRPKCVSTPFNGLNMYNVITKAAFDLLVQSGA